ncbi:MAG: lipocalin-like domain-containing protein [Candidatus Latescibacteria bacterium]|nr:lipocalin-like domain-containing protein [Candidatus Latescibacterota bacterium]
MKKKLWITVIITLLLFCLVSAIIFTLGCEQQSKAEKNKAIARLYIDELWNRKNLDDIDKLVSDDFVNHSSPPGMPTDREGLRQFITGSATTFPDGFYTIEDIITEQDEVMIRGSFKGTHRGEFMGIPGTGKEIRMTWINVLRMKNGKVVERWMKYDEINMMSQFGFKLIPPGEQKNPFIGTWELQSSEQRNADDPDSPPVYPMGRDIKGYIMYGEDGHMSVVLMNEKRPKFSSDDLTGGSVTEKTSAFDSYITYCGTYEVHEKEIIHHIQASLFPNWTGIDQKRLYEFEGDTLTLSTPPFPMGGINQTVILVWKRIK